MKKDLNTPEIEELVFKAQDGDQQSFAELYDIFVDPIYRYVYYRVNSADAEDLVETVFLKVWENLRQYRQQKNKSFSAWIFRITHNLVVDYYRKDKSSEELSINIPDQNRQHNPIKVTQDSMNKEVLGKAIKKLKPAYQEVIIYKFINELSNSEIAEILKKTEGSLRILQHRALKALKVELKDMGVE